MNNPVYVAVNNKISKQHQSSVFTQPYKGRITAGAPNKMFGTKTPSHIRQLLNLIKEA